MRYIQLDNFNGNINIISKDDESGEPLIFDTLLEATQSLDENCQDGIVVPLDTNIIKVFSDCEDFISQIVGEEGKENFEGIDFLTNTLDEILDIKEKEE